MGDPRIPARSELDRLCGPVPWQIIGVSALVVSRDGGHAYLEINRPRYWQTAPDGQTIVTIGAIGGHRAPGEGLLDCLMREAAEEMGVPLRIMGAAGTRLIYEGALRPGTFVDGDEPFPWFYTVAPNRRPEAAHDAGYLVIVTYQAEALGEPSPDDLFGLLVVPRDRLSGALPRRPIPLDALCMQTGAELRMNGELPAGTLVRPILTAESLRLVLTA